MERLTLYTKKHKIPFQIDSLDFDKVSGHTWCIDTYPATKIKGERLRLHEFIMGKAPKGLEWDHIDKDKLNNKRDNLRLVQHIVNTWNQNKKYTNTSGVSGVSWQKDRERWYSYITVRGKMKSLGRHRTMDGAVNARREAETKYWVDEEADVNDYKGEK